MVEPKKPKPVQMLRRKKVEPLARAVVRLTRCVVANGAVLVAKPNDRRVVPNPLKPAHSVYALRAKQLRLRALKVRENVVRRFNEVLKQAYGAIRQTARQQPHSYHPTVLGVARKRNVDVFQHAQKVQVVASPPQKLHHVLSPPLKLAARSP